MQNHLKDQTSPYLLQHADNPVDWYPWCEAAFVRARTEDKPVFLSIGYSTCHWCHVMAHESFEDMEIAEILNRYYISIKVDKEERPDLDSIYMSVCQAFTGSGGWPTTIFLTPEQKPFFAGTYFPKTAGYGQPGLRELLLMIKEQWRADRSVLLESADGIVSFLNRDKTGDRAEADSTEGDPEDQTRTNPDMDAGLIKDALEDYRRDYDKIYGGFGQAPKFPTPHNLLFLMRCYERSGDKTAMEMAEKTLLQMYRGGMFDHIGGGFSRYSTDRSFLVPHFEKMLYDNALLILAYSKAYQLTENRSYCDIAEQTAAYILREMTSAEGGFYSAQDADSEGVEGKYYLFEPSEVNRVLGGKAGNAFNRHFDITKQGNFEGKNIPNLLQSVDWEKSFDSYLPPLYAYRKNRSSLHLDDKLLASWNGLMIAAMCHLYRVTANRSYLETAKKAMEFIRNKLCDENTLYVSYRKGQRSGKGFLDDYANVIFALLALYEADLENDYLEYAGRFFDKAVSEFYDKEHGGFFLYGGDNEQLILRPKETYDGAIPSGNSVMAYNMVQLYLITGEQRFRDLAERQLRFIKSRARYYPAGYAVFLMALYDYMEEPDQITIVTKENQIPENLSCRIPLNTTIRMLTGPAKEYPMKDNATTYYICRGHSCLPPVNTI
ncbi:MAG: thioredoxin domain-containing protein [Lachnospiraceae bacterium]|nr:thioredoxin domain-containing protein [Lachnospiraceae bacterium]